jgi:hydroxypyruvate isomerase
MKVVKMPFVAQRYYRGYIGAEYRPKTQSDQSFAWKEKYFSNDVNT